MPGRENARETLTNQGRVYHSLTRRVGIPSYPELTPDGVSPLMKQTMPGCGGVCWLETPVTPFQDAVISFAGILGQAMFSTAPEWAPPFKPSAKMLRDWHNMVRQQIGKLSEGDRIGIFAYKDIWRACKSAFAIVRKNRSRITRLAKCLAESKAAADREFEKAAEAVGKWAASSPKLSTAEIAVHLQNALANYLPLDHTKRATYERALVCLKRGEQLPAELIAELEKK
jgi:hypothetical protein